ncbi:MAG: Gfo/Idh/MocA family oxidoreductase [Propionibacteriaceae bacterium]|nr:Gfo/Idh/MocA family oxidoreductase [Propionibacteriaceae bacterium]
MAVFDPLQAPPIRWGILGPGGIARRFARDVPLYTRSSIRAVGSRDIDRARTFVHEHVTSDREVRAYGSYEELVEDDQIDAVYIASPHSEHRDHALLALRADKPVLVEKAFTLNQAQAREVFAEARSRHLFVMEAMWSRFLPHYDAIRKIVESGELGDVSSIQGVHTQSLDLDPAWRMMNPALGGGALLDLGVYPLSLIHWLWGVPDRIKATGVLTSTGVDQRESISLWYGDRIAMAYADMGDAGASSLEIQGTQGRLEIADWFYTPQDIVLTPVDGEPRTLYTKVPGGFQYQAAEVARCLDAGVTESWVMPWTATLDVLATMDEVRRQLGVVYPCEQGE